MQEDDGEKKETVLTFEADASEVDDQVEKFFKKEGQNEVPGFRKGHAPREVLIKAGGGHDAAYAKIAEELINDLGFAAIDDADVVFTSEPQFNVTGKLEDHKPFTFTVSGQTVPILKLSSTDPVTIQMPPEEATDTEVHDHIESLREYYYVFQTADKKAEKGDYVLVHMTCSTEGHNINGLTDTDRLVGIGEGSMPEEFDDHLIGTKAGDQLFFDFTVGDKSKVEFNTDGTVHVEAEVKEVRVKKLPELDDEFAQKLGSENVEQLEKAVRALINQSKREQLPQIMEDRCVEAMAQRLEGEIPADYIDYMRNNVLADFFDKLNEKDINIQDYILHNNLRSEQIKSEAQEQAEQVARENVTLDTLFSQAGMELTDEDIEREFA
ncbi:MAG: trigger factor, partial [Coriobacteriales bacterium]